MTYPSRYDRRRFLAFAGTLALGAQGNSLLAQELDPEKTGAEVMTKPALRAISRGLAYLARRQHEEGSFGSGGYARNVGVAALAGMAFLSSGSTPGRGPYAKQIDLCVDFLLSQAEDSGYIHVPTPTHGPMYGHGFATLFLAEVYGMTRRRELRVTLKKAVDLIVATQNAEGGWRYQPERREADISVTICQVMALRAARNAGLYVPRQTIDQCVSYVKRSQNPDGGFMYLLAGGPSEFPRSAAGVVALYSAGIYEGPEITKGLKYLMQFLPTEESAANETHFYYGHYYAAQAMWQAGGKMWNRWYPAIRDVLVKLQREDGSWMDTISPEYGTSMASIILQMPNNYLPIFQR